MKVSEASLRSMSREQLIDTLAKTNNDLRELRLMAKQDTKQWSDAQLLKFMRGCLRHKGSKIHDEIEPIIERHVKKMVEGCERRIHMISACLCGQPSWGFPVDNETMFYCSKAMWDMYEQSEEKFGDDDREARRLALLAAELFQELHAGTDWEKEDYTFEIWAYVNRLKAELFVLEDISEIQDHQALRKALGYPERPTNPPEDDPNFNNRRGIPGSIDDILDRH